MSFKEMSRLSALRIAEDELILSSGKWRDSYLC